MKKQWGFTAEIESFKAMSMYDVEEDTLILLTSPVSFKDGKLDIPEDIRNNILDKTVTEDYGYLAHELIIKDPTGQEKIDLIPWLAEMGFENKVQIRFGFKQSKNDLRQFADFWFESIDKALEFKFAFGDYGIVMIDGNP